MMKKQDLLLQVEELQAKLNAAEEKLSQAQSAQQVPAPTPPEQALQASETRFRLLAETTSAAIFITRDMHILYANDAAQFVTGYSCNEILATELWKIAHPAYQEVLRRSDLTQSWAPNIPNRFELKIVTRSGQERWLDVTAGSIDYEGQPAALLTGFDITERDRVEKELKKTLAELESRVAERTADLQLANLNLQIQIEERNQTEAELRESETRFRTLIDEAPLGIALSRESKFLYANPEYLRMHNISNANDLIGQPVLENVAPESLPEANERAYRRAHGQPAEQRYEYTAIRKGGTRLHILAAVAEVTLSDGPATVGFFQDISERRQAEAELQETEERYRLLFENSQDGIMLTRPDGSVHAANATACRIFGRSEEEICQGGRNLVLDWSDPRIAAALEERARTGKFYSEFFMFRSDGTRFSGEVSSVVFKDRTGALKTSMIVRDITERKRMEEALRASEVRYRTLFERMGEGFYLSQIVLDEAGQPSDFIYLDVNPAFERIMGLTREQIIGHRAKELVPNLRADWVEVVGKVALTGESARYSSYSDVFQQYFEIFVFRPAEMQFAALVTDISERKKTEAALQESEKRWATTLESIGDAVIATDTSGQITFMNAVAQTLTGWSLSEAERKPIHKVFNIINELSRQEVENPVTRVLQSGGVVGLANHTLLIRKDGAEIAIDDSGAPIKDNSGQLMGVVLVFRDISERKQIEDSLRDSEERYRNLVEMSPEAVFLNRDNRIVYANPAMLELFGANQPDQLLGLSPFDIFQPGDHALIQKRIAQVLQGQPLHLTELKFRRLDGTMRDVESIATLTSATDRSIQVILRDITTRKQAEQQLRLQSAALQSAANGIVITDRQGAIQWVNPAFTKLTGYSAEEALGKNPRVLKSGRHDAAFYKNLWDTIRSGQSWHGEIVNQRKDGSLYTEEMTITPVIDLNGSITNFIAIKQDVTERKRTEEALLESRAILQGFYDGSPFLMGVTELDGDSVIGIHGNNAAARLLGALPAKDLDRSAETINRIELESYLWIEQYQRCLRERKPVRFEYREPKTTNPRWFAVTIAFIGIGILGRPRFSFVAEDITERKGAEKKASTILATMQSGYWLYDRSGRLLEVNDAYCQMSGFSREELLEMHVQDLEAIETSQAALDHIQFVTKQGYDQFETYHRRKDGSIFDVDIRTSYLDMDGGRVVSFIWDISRRKKDEQALRESQKRTSDILESINDGFFELDRDWGFTYINQRAAGNIGRSPEELIGKSIWESFPSILGTTHEFYYRQVMEQQQPASFEIEGIFTAKSYNIRIYPSAEGITVYWIDISESKRMEQAVKQSEERFAKAFHSSPVPISLASLVDGRLIDVNNSYLNLFECSRDEIIGRTSNNVQLYVHPDERDTLRNLARTDGSVRNYETKLYTQTGKILDVLISSEFMELDGEGCILATAIDISERKRVEKALLESEERFRAVLENALDAAYRQDLQLDRYDYMSPVFEQLTGWPVKEIIGADTNAVLSRVHPNDLPYVEQELTRTNAECTANGRSSASLEYRFLCKDGQYRWLGDYLSVLPDSSGRPLYRSGIMRDITDLKKKEAELYQLNRTLKALSDSNQAMMRAQSESEFLDEACRIIVEDCGHKMVWVGYAENDEQKTVRPVAFAGFEAGYIDSLKVTWADTKRGRGPTGTAIRTGKPAGCQNMLTDPNFAPWRAEAIKRGYASSLVIPMIMDGTAIGAITIYSQETEAFSESEVNLLSELASDLVYGITVFRARAAHAQAEAALEVSEERYRSLFNSLTEGFALHEIVCDEAGQPVDYRFLEINPAFEKFTGLSRENVVGKLHNEVLPGDDPYWLEVYGAVALTGQPIHIENYSPALKQHYEVYAYQPAPGQFAVLFMNITERKNMEQALRSSQANLLSLIENTDDHIWSVDPQYCLITANSAFRARTEKLLGHPLISGECLLLGDTRRDILVDWKGYYDRALSGEKFNIEIAPHKTAQDWMEYYLNPIKTPDGNSIGVTVMGHNITGRKRAAEALRQSEEKYRTLFETMTEGVIFQDAEGRNISVNPAAERMLGLTKDQLIGLTSFDPRWQTIYPDGSPFPSEQHPIVLAQKTGQPVLGVMMGVFKPSIDSYGWMIVNAIPQFRPTEIQPFQVYVTFEDITELKRAEEKLSFSNKNLEFLSSTAVHFLQPLTADEVFSFVGQQIQILAGDAAVIVNELDPVRDITTVHDIAGHPAELEQLHGLLGADLIGQSFPVLPGTRQRMTQGELSLVKGGLYKLSFEQLPIELCQAIEQQLGLGDIYAIPFGSGFDFLGTVAILTHTRGVPENASVMCALISQAGIALKRIRAEQQRETLLLQLEAERIRWETTVESMLDPVLVADKEGCLIYVNPAYKQIAPRGFDTGIRPDDVSNHYKLYTPDGQLYSSLDLPMEIAALKGIPVKNREVVICDSPGTEHTVIWNAAPLFDTEGHLNGSVAVGHDITLQRQVEAERERLLADNNRQRRLLETIFEVNPSGIAVLSGDTLIFQLVNPTYRAMTPLPEEDPVGKNYDQVWIDPTSLSRKDIFQEALKTGKPVDIESELRIFPDGTTRYFSTHVRRFPWDSGNGLLVVLQDTTQIEVISREARRRADEMTTIFNSMTDVVTIFNKEGNPIQANPAAVAVYGYDPVGTPRINNIQRLEMRHPNGQPFSIEELPSTRVLRGETIRNLRFTITNAQSIEFTVDCSASPLFSSGDISGAVIVLHDITEREKLYNQLSDERARFKAIFENAPQGIVLTDANGQFVLTNAVADRLYESPGSSNPNPAESQQLEFRHPDGTPYAFSDLPLMQSALKGKTLVNAELDFHWKDGFRRNLLVNSVPINDFQGKVSGAIGVFQDISQLKQAQIELQMAHNELEWRVQQRTQELAQANESLHIEMDERKQIEEQLLLQMTAVESAANGIIITDRDGKIGWCNPAFLSMTGFKLEEVLGRNPGFLNSGVQKREFYREMWNTILSGQVWRGEVTNKRKDGSLYIEEQAIAPVFNEEGNLTHFVSVRQDISERKQFELQLERNNEDLRALSDAERQQRQLAETLSAANMALSQSLNLETVMETLLDYVGKLVPFDSAKIMLFESETRLAVRMTRGYEHWADAEKIRSMVIDLQGRPILHKLFSTRKGVLIPDTSVEPGWETLPGLEYVHSWLGVPMMANSNPIGVFTLEKAEPGFFTLEHIQLVNMLVGQAVVAVQNAWLYEQVRAGRERLQSLSRRLVEIQEMERRYVARELHDEAGQALTALIFGLGQLERDDNPLQRSSQIEELKQMTHTVLENIHQLAVNLRPASLDHLGLVPSLKQFMEMTGDRYSMNAEFVEIGFEEERLAPDIETALYRIVQESTTNAVRHGHAKSIDVLLERIRDDVILIIEDDGVGFDADQAILARSGRLGLLGMQERAEMLGGSMVIESAVGKGTTIVVKIPHAKFISASKTPDS